MTTPRPTGVAPIRIVPDREGREVGVLLRRGAILVAAVNGVVGAALGAFYGALATAFSSEETLSTADGLLVFASGFATGSIPALLGGVLVGLPLERATRQSTGTVRSLVALGAGAVIGGVVAAALTQSVGGGLLGWGAILGALSGIVGRALVDAPWARHPAFAIVLAAVVAAADVVGFSGLR